MKHMHNNSEILQKAWMLVNLIQAYYKTELTGGCCHIVLDDGNYEVQHVEYCYTEAKRCNDIWAFKICQLLFEFDKSEREQIIERGYEIEEQIKGDDNATNKTRYKSR